MLQEINNIFFKNIIAERRFTIMIFLRLIAVVYLIAFSSVLIESEILLNNGVISFSQFAKESHYLDTFYLLLNYPSIFWVTQADWFILFVLILSIIISFICILKNINFYSYLLLWFFYLSIVTFGGDLFQFPWDTFLLEIGFVSIFIAFYFNKNTLPQILYISMLMLFFRQWLSMSLTKLLWSDPAWYDLTFIKYFWLNQPSPTFISLYLYQLPLSVQKLICMLILVIELSIPILMLFRRKGRIIAFFFAFFLSVTIQIIGNFGFFNLLTIVISLLLLDDCFFQRKINRTLDIKQTNNIYTQIKRNSFVLIIFPVFILFNIYYLLKLFIPTDNPHSHGLFLNYSLIDVPDKKIFIGNRIRKLYSNYRIVSPHGVFKYIPKKRLGLEFYTISRDSIKTKYDIKHDILRLNWTAPFMYRVPYSLYYIGYGIDFSQALSNLNTIRSKQWINNYIKIISKEDIKTVVIYQVEYTPKQVHYKWTENDYFDKYILDSINININQELQYPLFKLNYEYLGINK